MIAPKKNVNKKASDWNSFLITIDHRQNYGEVIHNGTKVSNFSLSGDSWDEMVKNSKFSNYEDKSFRHGDFGKFKKAPPQPGEVVIGWQKPKVESTWKQLRGRTEGDEIVVFEGPSELLGTITEVRALRASPLTVHGEWALAEGSQLHPSSATTGLQP